MTKLALALCASAALVSSASAAITYTNFSAGYIFSDLDVPGADNGNGIGIGLEVSPFEHVYLTGGASWSLTSSDIGDLDSFTGHAGVGGYYAITDSFHIAGDLGIAFSDVEASGLDGSDSAFYVRPHVRAQLTEIIELHVGAQYANFNTTDGEWSAFGNLYISVFGNAQLMAGVGVSDDATTATAGVRISF